MTDTPNLTTTPTSSAFGAPSVPAVPSASSPPSIPSNPSPPSSFDSFPDTEALLVPAKDEEAPAPAKHDAVPPEPPPHQPKSRFPKPSKGGLLAVLFFLLLTLPLSVKLISDQRQLAELRSRAYEIGECASDADCGEGGRCKKTRIEGVMTTVCESRPVPIVTTPEPIDNSKRGDDLGTKNTAQQTQQTSSEQNSQTSNNPECGVLQHLEDCPGLGPTCITLFGSCPTAPAVRSCNEGATQCNAEGSMNECSGGQWISRPLRSGEKCKNDAVACKACAGGEFGGFCGTWGSPPACDPAFNTCEKDSDCGNQQQKPSCQTCLDANGGDYDRCQPECKEYLASTACFGFKPDCRNGNPYCLNGSWHCPPSTTTTPGSQQSSCQTCLAANGGDYDRCQPECKEYLESTARNAQPTGCDRSAPDTGQCTDKNAGSSCQRYDGRHGTCQVISYGGANVECSCVVGGPTPPVNAVGSQCKPDSFVGCQSGAECCSGVCTGGTCRSAPSGGGGGGTGGGGMTPTQPPGAPQCTRLKIYKNGQEVAPSKLSAGDAVKLAIVAGSASKGRIRVNGGSWMETTTKNSAGEFTVDFTIPSGVTSFTVEGEIYSNGSWQ